MNVDTYDLLSGLAPARATFTVLIGSIGRPSLRRALESAASQNLRDGDQVIVGFDAFEQSAGELEDRIALVRSFGPGFQALAHVGHNATDGDKVYPDGTRIKPGQPYHWLGVEQINQAIRTIPMTGTHVFTIGDDDMFVPGAYDALRPFCEADMLRPVIYRFVAPPRCVLWDKPRLRSCLISGCCIAAPRPFVREMHTRIETTHDYDWIVDVVGRAKAEGRDPLWLDYIGVVARPDAKLQPSWLYPPRIVEAVADTE